MCRYKIFDWFVEDKILLAYQERPFASKGKAPFCAKTDFRYIADEDRGQMTWLTVGASGVITGGLEEEGVIASYEHPITGDHRKLDFKEGMRYVLRNITRDSRS